MNERGYEPCPFCGSEDVWGTFYAPMEHLVFCGECGAKIMGATSYDEAKKLWNRRSTGKWIPCKDRLPDAAGFYIVSVSKNLLETFNKGDMLIWHFDGEKFEFGLPVAAWHKAPEPYKEEGTDGCDMGASKAGV